MTNGYGLLGRVKKNLIITHNADNALIKKYIAAAVSYAEEYQHLEAGYYLEHEMSETTKQGVVMLASHFYESRDGSTGGFFGDTIGASAQAWEVINNLLRLGREWKV